ncbi:S8 family serine peptidase [Bacillus sp. SCS-153A]|uniref:S8 family serine peptidase n=1 Tax=Rossellomorea sedimentorum TaxID=3115294 RepID=UPI003905A7E1
MKIKSILISLLLMISMFSSSWALHEASSTSMDSKAVVDENLVQKLASTLEPVEVIVTFKDGVLENGTNILKSAGITKGISFESLPMAGVLATKNQVEKLAESSEVVSIYLNSALEYENADATSITGVDKVRTNAAMTKQNGGFPVSGKGVGVVINDSGVDGTHNDHKYGSHLVQNVLGSTNLNAMSGILPVTYTENVPNTDNNSGHGTHVAGIVGGTGAMSGGKYEGVAPGANLIGYGSGAALAMLDTLGGFDYALTHQREYNIRVITNSWGATSQAGQAFDPYDPINIATKKLFDRGIVTVFSAGNSGPDASTISGNYKKAPWVVTVAAGNDAYELASFSSRGEKGKGGTVVVDGMEWTWSDRPTITAPGVDIISTRVLSPIPVLGAPKDVQNIDPAHIPYYTTMSGTSMAAPHAAGVIALMLDADPTLTPLEVKNILEETAKPMPGYEAWETGAGYIDAFKAVEKAFGLK